MNRWRSALILLLLVFAQARAFAQAPPLVANSIKLGPSANPVLFSVRAGSPNGVVAGNAGDAIWDTSTPALWQCQGGTVWTQISGSIPATTHLLQGTGTAGSAQATNETDNGTTFGAGANFSVTLSSGTTTIAGQTTTGGLAEGVLSPASIAGTVDNWSPTGWTGSASVLIEVALSNNATLDGLVALNTGALVTLCNMSTSFILIMQDNAAGSTAANRFTNQGGVIILGAHAGPEPECANYIYDSTISRWVGTSTTASTIHNLTIQSGLTVQSSGISNSGGLISTVGGAGTITNLTAETLSNIATFNTTAGGLQAVGLNSSVTSTRSSGANTLTDIAAQFNATGGQVNQSIVTANGDEVFNTSSGSAFTDNGLSCSIPNNGVSLQVTNTATAQTSGSNDIAFSNNATYNTTGGAIEQQVVNVTPNCSISAGANALSCVGMNVGFTNSATNNYGITTQPGSRVSVGMDAANVTSYTSMLQVRNDASVTGADPLYNATFERNNNATVSGVKWAFWRIHGTFASPTQTSALDEVGAREWDGVNTGGTRQEGMIEITKQDQAPAAAATPLANAWVVTGQSGNALVEAARLTSTGHTIYGLANQPTLSSCGSGPTIDGTDTAGTITEGTGATGCTITFGTAWNVTNPDRSPHCTLYSESGYIFQFTESVTAITITNIGPLSSTSVDYHCFGGGAS